MRVNRYNFIWSVLLCTTVVFGQKHTKNINESFKVNADVLVEIDTRHSDVTVETWNKNIVSVQGVWEIEGMTKEEANQYFKGWKFEALGNKNKVEIKSNSSSNYYSHSNVFDDMDFDFDFDFDMDSIAHIGEMFNGDYYSDLPSVPPMPAMSPMPPMPPFKVPAMKHLPKLEFDYEAYQKDKEVYMKEFEKRQQVWEKEFEEKIEPQMKAYEKKMEEWEKKMEPQMKAYEEKMKQWEKEYAPQMKAYEKRMEVRAKKMEVRAKKVEKRLQKMEKEMEVKYAKKMKEKGTKISKRYNIKKSLLIKVPRGATLKVDVHYGKIILPNNIKIID